MGLFGIKLETTKQNAVEIKLEKEFKFMYESFIISSQSKLYLLLEMNEEIIDVLSFDFVVYKYGYPNDEVGNTSKIAGLNLYLFNEVKNSEWINELKINNRSHSQHQDKFSNEHKHYTIRFKDVSLEVITRKKYELIKMTKTELNEIINQELSYLK